MRAVLDVRPGERALTFGAFGALFAMTGGHTLLETARDALFLAKLPPERLPWMYLGIAAVGLIVARLGKRTSGAVGVSLAAAIAVTLLFWAASGRAGAPFVYALFIWTGTLGSWVVLQFWLLLGRVMHVGQAKRLFGFIGSGGVLGATAGAAAARALAGEVEARHLLVAASALFALAIVPSRLVERRAPIRRPEARSATRRGGGLVADARATARDPYLRRILALALVATICLTFVDYLFKAIVAHEVPKEHLARTFASIYTVVNATALVVQLGLVSTALRVLGVHRALAILPLLTLAGGFGVFAVPALGAAFVLKGFDGVLRHSMHKTTTELLYLPLEESSRSRAKPVIDLLAQRGGQAVASVALLVVAAAGGSLRVLAAAVIVLAGAWLALAIRMGKPYLDSFRASLKRGRIDADIDLPELDLGALEALFAALNSPRDAEVLGALDLLAAQNRNRLIPALILYHPSSTVVLRALELLAAEGREDFLPITSRLLDHADPTVRAAALRARAKVAPDTEELRGLLEDPRLEIRATALVTLVARGSLGAAEGRAELSRALDDPSPSLRLAVVEAIAQDPHESFAPVLVEHAAKEKDAEVQSGLAVALGAFGSADVDKTPLVAALAMLLPLRTAGPAARAALAELAGPDVELLADLFTHEQPAVAWSAPRVLERCPAEKAAPLLLEAARHSKDGLVRFRSLKALTRLRRSSPALNLERPAIIDLAAATIRGVYDLTALRVALAAGQEQDRSRATASGQLLEVLLRDKVAYAMGRLFLILGLLYPAERFERIQRGVASTDPKLRAQSRELCENVVEAPLRAPPLILIDDLPDTEKLARHGGFAPTSATSYSALLSGLAARQDEVGALARHHALEVGVKTSPEDSSAHAGASAFARRVRATPSPIAEESHG
jgi:HEAT repeat protein